MFFMMSAVIPSNFMTITAPWSPRWGKFGGAMEGADHGQALCTAELCNFCQFWWLCQFSWNFEYSKALKNANLWQNKKKRKLQAAMNSPRTPAPAGWAVTGQRTFDMILNFRMDTAERIHCQFRYPRCCTWETLLTICYVPVCQVWITLSKYIVM